MLQELLDQLLSRDRGGSQQFVVCVGFLRFGVPWMYLRQVQIELFVRMRGCCIYGGGCSGLVVVKFICSRWFGMYDGMDKST